MPEPRIVEKPAFRVIGLEAVFHHSLSPDATNLQVIGVLWESFLHRSREVRHKAGDAMFGVIPERPPSQLSHPDELQYLAAVPVHPDAAVPHGMVERTVPAGTFAVFIHCGPIRNIGETVRGIYCDWLPQSAWRHAGTDDVELYDHRFKCDADDSEMEYWIPVAPRVPSDGIQ